LRAENPEAASGPRRVAPRELVCAECEETFLGRAGRVVCGKRRCKDRRYARPHPDKAREGAAEGCAAAGAAGR
jgi:hypothetical protein